MKKDYSYGFIILVLVILLISSNKDKEKKVSADDNTQIITINSEVEGLQRQYSELLKKYEIMKNSPKETMLENKPIVVYEQQNYKPLPYIPENDFRYYLMGRGNGTTLYIALSNETEQQKTLTFSKNKTYNYEIYDSKGRLLYTLHENIRNAEKINKETLSNGQAKVFTLRLKDILKEGSNTYTLIFKALANELGGITPLEVKIKGSLVIPAKPIEEIIDDEVNEVDKSDEIEENDAEYGEEINEDEKDEEIQEEYRDVQIDELIFKYQLNSNQLILINENEELKDELKLLVKYENEEEYIDIVFEENLFELMFEEEPLEIDIILNEESISLSKNEEKGDE